MIKNYLKIIKQVMIIAFVLLLGSCPVFFVCAEAAEEPGGLYSAGAVLMDADSGRVLFSKSPDTPFAMASTTKIMTCILALELAEEDRIVTFSDRAAAMPDVQMNAKAGEQYYLIDLIYSVMLESHNDSAAAVAEAVGGSIEGFADLMNRKAEAIGCTNTHFVTPNGLDGTDEGGDHQTTAKELAMILRYCISISSKAERFLEITGKDAYEFWELNQKRYVTCRNHNALLSSYEGGLTGKTGFTGKAGYCYVGAAKRDDRTFIVALLGAGWYPHKSYKWKDAGKLLDYAFDEFHYETVGSKAWELKDAALSGGMKSSVKLGTDAGEFEYLLKKGETPVCKVDYTKVLEAPVTEGTVIGKITYELEGTVIEQFRIFTAETIEKATFWNRLKKWIGERKRI